MSVEIPNLSPFAHSDVRRGLFRVATSANRSTQRFLQLGNMRIVCCTAKCELP